MYRRIVVGYDGRPASKDALALAGRLADAMKASVLVAYVSPEQPRWYKTQRDFQRDLRLEVADILLPALTALPEGVSATKASIGSTSPARGLHDLAAEEHATLLVLGSTHLGTVGRVVIGSAGELLLMGAPCAVTVAPRGYAERADDSFDLVGVGFDGSAESEIAVQSAHALAGAVGARLRAIGVVETRLFQRLPGVAEAGARKLGEARDALLERFERILAALPGAAEVERTMLEGNPSDALAGAAAETDLMVVGSRGYGPLHHVLLGSVSSRLMRRSPAPLLVVPRGAPTPIDDLRADAAATRSGA
jgi:nucleotide-binding universal stress UspA family protein